MRLQLIAAAAVLLSAAPAAAQTAFSSKVQLYVDDDHTQVVSPVVEAQADVSDSTNVSAGYLADVISSASIDVVTQASSRTIHDTRHQVSLSASHAFDTLTLHGGYTFAIENDYAAHTASLSAEQAFDDKNTTIGVGWALTHDEVGRAGDHNFEKELTVNDATVTLTQVLNRKAIAQLTYELGYSDGFQSSPYRFVPIEDTMGTPMFWVPETDPGTRWRHAAVVAGNFLVPGDAALQADYRLYHDTWGITSHTAGLRWIKSLGKKAELRLRERFYAQNGAAFYHPAYHAVSSYMALDRELSPLWSETFGAKLSVDLTSRLEGEVKVDGFYYHYDDFPYLASRLGANVGLGLQLTY
jgi:hypothetical protein